MKRRYARIIKTLAMLVVVLAACYGVAWWLAARSLRQAYAELEADGRPLALDEAEWKPVPPAQNAAPLYQAASLLLNSESIDAVSLFNHLATNTWAKPDDPRSPEAIDSELRAALKLEVCVEALKLIEKGAARPDYRFIGNPYDPAKSPLDGEKGHDRFKCAGMLSLGRLLNARARLQMADGDRDGAWATALTSFRFAGSFSKIPIMVGQLLRLVLAEAATESVRNLCAVSLPDPEDMDELQHWIRTFDDPAPIAHAIDIERIVIDRQLFRHPSAQIDVSDDGVRQIPLLTALLLRTVYLKPVRLADYAYYLRSCRRVAQAYERMDPKAALQSDDIFERAPVFHPFSYCNGTRDYRPRMRGCFANLRITSAGLAALEYRREHGVFPESLSDLDGLNVIDPFTGETLAYQAGPDGFVIASSGPKEGPEDDVVWQYQTPSKESISSMP